MRLGYEKFLMNTGRGTFLISHVQKLHQTHFYSHRITTKLLIDYDHFSNNVADNRRSTKANRFITEMITEGNKYE